MTDGEIIELFNARSGDAVTEASKAYSGRLKRLALSFLGSEQDAEEALNDAYMKAWQTIPPMEPDDLFGYLARLVRCTCFDMLDKRSALKRSACLVELTSELSECIADTSTDFEAGELAELLNSFLSKQKPYKRRLFVLRYFYGLKISELAAETGFSESKVNTALSRIRRELKDYLKRKGVSL